MARVVRVDGTTQGLAEGYDAFIENKNTAGVSCVRFSFLSFFSSLLSMRVY
jgi:hypothetical protein